MKKEVVTYTPSGIPEPYNAYIRERNANVGKHLAEIQGTVFSGEYTDTPKASTDKFYVPAKTLPISIAENLGIVTSEDLYGGVVEHAIFATKSVLHPTLYSNSPAPGIYPRNFASVLTERNLVLPGYTTFDSSQQEAFQIFNLLREQGFVVRLKEPDQSDGDGQAVISDTQYLRNLLDRYPGEVIFQKGLILETNVQNGKTVSIGQTSITGKDYTHIAFQKDIRQNGRTIYGGATMMIFKGNLENLIQNYAFDPDVTIALKQSYQIHQAYGELDPKLSRASYDVLQGFDSKGNFLSGVTDQTFRLGGSSPAEVLAIEYLNNKPDINFVDAEVTLDYSPNSHVGAQEIIFLDQPQLRITAKLIESNI